MSETKKSPNPGRKTGCDPAHFKALTRGRKLALVIGVGAVGGAIARALLKYGDYCVVLVGRHQKRAKLLMQEFADAGYPDRVFAFSFDATDRVACRSFAEHMSKRYEAKFDLLVLAAGKAVLDRESDGDHPSLWSMKQNEPNVMAKINPFIEFAASAKSALVVSSIAAGFAKGDPRMRRMHAYAGAMQTLEEMAAPVQEVPELGVSINYDQCIVWRCPLVQGDTASEFVAHGIVNADTQRIPAPDEVVKDDLVPLLRAADLLPSG